MVISLHHHFSAVLRSHFKNHIFIKRWDDVRPRESFEVCECVFMRCGSGDGWEG